jgi:hypothetical protein
MNTTLQQATRGAITRITLMLLVLFAVLASCGVVQPPDEGEGDTRLQAMPASNDVVLSSRSERILLSSGQSFRVKVIFREPMKRASVESAFNLFPGEYNTGANPVDPSKLQLEATCDGRWAVYNPNVVPVSFTWQIHKSPENGKGHVLPKEKVYFESTKGRKMLSIFANEALQSRAMANTRPCPIKRPFEMVRRQQSHDDHHSRS